MHGPSKRVDLRQVVRRVKASSKNENIPKLSEEFKEICEGRVRIEEITEVLKSTVRFLVSTGFRLNFTKLFGTYLEKLLLNHCSI